MLRSRLRRALIVGPFNELRRAGSGGELGFIDPGCTSLLLSGGREVVWRQVVRKRPAVIRRATQRMVAASVGKESFKFNPKEMLKFWPNESEEAFGEP